jgi:hypothetical protein
MDAERRQNIARRRASKRRAQSDQTRFWGRRNAVRKSDDNAQQCSKPEGVGSPPLRRSGPWPRRVAVPRDPPAGRLARENARPHLGAVYGRTLNLRRCAAPLGRGFPLGCAARGTLRLSEMSFHEALQPLGLRGRQVEHAFASAPYRTNRPARFRCHDRSGYPHRDATELQKSLHLQAHLVEPHAQAPRGS